MLTTITKKLCPFVSLVMATISCGKKITEESSGAAHSIQNQNPPSTVVIKLDGNVGSEKTYKIPMNGQFSLPTKLKVREGNISGKKILLTYNVDEDYADDYEFRCFYVPGPRSDEMSLEFCEDSVGRNLGDVAEPKFMMDAGKLITMEIKNSSSAGIIVDSIFIVDWK